MHTIAFVTQKGGAGKTTLAASLAVAAAHAGEKVVALDLDPQGSLMGWGEARDGNELAVADVTIDRLSDDRLSRLPSILEGLARKGFTVAVLDTAGVESTATHMAMQVADLCLIPARPTRIDIMATKPTFRAVHRLGREVAFVLNQCPAVARSTRATEAAGGLSLLGVLAKPLITIRADHQDAIAAGLGVTEYAPGGKAAQEVEALWSWVVKNREGQADGTKAAATIGR